MTFFVLTTRFGGFRTLRFCVLRFGPLEGPLRFVRFAFWLRFETGLRLRLRLRFCLRFCLRGYENDTDTYIKTQTYTHAPRY